MSTLELDERGVIETCPQCGTANRLAYERLGQPPRCAKCGASLPPPAEPIDVSEEEMFSALTRRSAVPVLVDFWAEWCGPCKMMGPEVAKAARAAGGAWITAKVNTEALPGLAQRIGISAIPLLVLFDGGQEVARDTGARPAAAIQQFVQQHGRM